MRWKSAYVLPLAAGLWLLAPLWAQLPDALTRPAAPSGADADPLGRSTPRGAALGFLRTAQQGNWTLAVQYLEDRPKGLATAELAKQLKAVMDADLVTNLDRLSDNPAGSLDQTLSPGLERVGKVATPEDTADLLLARKSGVPGQIWLFSADSLKLIPAFFDDIDRPGIEAHLPNALVRTHVFSLRLWQLLALLLAIPAAFAIASIVTRVLILILQPLIGSLTKERDERRLHAIAGPVRLIALVLVMRSGTYILALPLLARQVWIRLVGVLAVAAIAWLLVRVVDVTSELMRRHLARTGEPASMAVVHLVRRLLKTLAVGIGVLLILQGLGFNLTPVFAGISIGGIAIALAAQKTLENLFGGVMLITDEPVRIGDFCRFGDRTGTVEDIGLRSTRIRTLDRTVVAVPNGQLAAMSLEDFNAREKIWFHPTIGLRSETSADQLRFVLAEIRKMLYGHPKIETSTARVRFVKFGDSTLDLEVFAYVPTADYNEFLAVQEDVLLRVMDIVQESGTALAFPSRTLYFGRDTGLDEERSRAAAAQVAAWRAQNALPFPNFPPEEIAKIENRLDYPPNPPAR